MDNNLDEQKAELLAQLKALKAEEEVIGDNLMNDGLRIVEIADEMETAIKAAPAGPALDIEARTITTTNGNVIQLSSRRLSSLMIERLQAAGRPQIPLVEVTVGGTHKTVEYHAHDPGYLAALEEWESEANGRVLRYMFVRGVNGDPDDEFIAETLEWLPAADRQELKYLWVASLVPDEDLNEFIEMLMSQYNPTVEGVDDVAAGFRSEGQR